jgi:cytochrome c551/c552
MKSLPLLALITTSVCYPQTERALLNQYCITCHNEKTKTGGLMLDKLDVAHVGDNPETWEKVVRKLRAGMMPPSGAPRPGQTAIDDLVTKIESELDQAAAAKANPGTTSLHRLNRAEYANAIRDLLALDVDAATLLPTDNSSEGFDNIADALGVSPALLERYVGAATKVSRLAVGDPSIGPSTDNYRVPGDLSQGQHIEGLPLGTRGGIVIHHTFPLDAEYSFKIQSRSNVVLQPVGRNEEIEITLNGERVKLLKANGLMDVKLNVKAGPQTIGVALVDKNSRGVDDIWQVLPNSSGVASIAINGPLNATGPGDTPSRRRIFICQPAAPGDETSCAKKILTSLATRAFRRPATDGDLELLLGFYQAGRNQGTFETGIERALERVLVDPRFIFRFEQEPPNLPAGAAYRITDLELASRLSFFLWSSIPDDELLRVAGQGKLHEPAVLAQQTRRMLADPRSEALVSNFAGQWLMLRDVKTARPEAKGFDDNLRQAFRHETELFFDSIVREDRSVNDLLTADYTFVDERLARHYGIQDIYGSQFRRVTLPDDNRRGLLGQGSILLATSVANRTSPVARGKWILENVLGSSPPLPPPNVPALEDSGGEIAHTVRQKMEQHRSNPVCASCHKIMDPIGFSLENFDLTGKWRSTDGGVAIDASGQLVDGTKLDGAASLRAALLARPGVFASTLTEKLLMYATGRGLKYYDMPVVRSIRRDAARDDYRFSSIVLGIVKSPPFQMKMKVSSETE